MEIREIFLLDDDYPAKNCVLTANSSGSVTFPHQVKETTGINEIFDLTSSNEDVPSTKIEKHTSGDGFGDIKYVPVKQEAIDLTIDVLLDAKRPVKQELIDLTGLDSESDNENISASKNNEDAFASSTTTGAIDVSHLFDFSSTNFLIGPAYMGEDEDSDDTNWVGIFHSPLRLPQALPQTPTRSEKYSLRPRPRPSAHNTLSCAKSPPAKRRKRANKKNHGNAEDNPGWKGAYETLLKKYNRLQKDYDVLTKRVQMAKVDAQRGGTSTSPSRRTQSDISALGSASRTNQEPDSPERHVSNVYSLLC
ncbi:hypothetical protein IW262DRAFT_527044 [Armillaria fumosa]|nr:hypothetical protein IW262DRAFT_527044 [Armillaria fumosa]